MVRIRAIIVITATVWLGVVIAQPVPALATTNFIYPLGTWQVSTTHGEDLGGLYHMGVDVGYGEAAGTPVYAVADGIVREAEERSQFGLVVLIEHFPEAETADVSLYGHLDPTQVLVMPGQAVAAGDQIGVLGSADNNGGWTPHLHFGIHKSPYTGEWVYYGHVQDIATAEDWYDPVTYIPEHLVADTWSPTVSLDLGVGAIVGETVEFTTTARDLGSTVKSLKYRISDNGGTSWTTVATASAPTAESSVTLPLYAYLDGDLLIRVVVRDYFKNKTVLTTAVIKDPYRSTLPAFVAMKSGKSDAFVTQWSFAGTALQAIFPFQTTWRGGGDIALGDVLGEGANQMIVGKGTPHDATKIKVLSSSGEVLASFNPFTIGTPRVTTADTSADGTAEIIVGSGKRQTATVAAFNATGELVWSLAPFGEFARQGLDVAAANLDSVAGDEIVVGTRSGDSTICAVLTADGSAVATQFYPFKKSFTGGIHVTAGDLTGDSVSEIVAGTESNRIGSVRVFNAAGEKLFPGFHPFGDTFTGGVDVALVQWDTTEDAVVEAELLVSQASHGQAWIKVYRLSGTEPEVVFEKRVYEPDFVDGTRIAGYL